MDRFRTKKAARKAGYYTWREWMTYKRNLLVPRIDAKPVVVKGENFYFKDDCEELIFHTRANELGLRIRANATPATTLPSRYGPYDLFRISDCEAKPVRQIKSPKRIDLLRAIFAVNKSAKRYRDASEKYYKQKLHGFARSASFTKKRLYTLKDRGILTAYRTKRLGFEGMHAGLAVYRGEGYCFHSPLVPKEHFSGEIIDDCAFKKESAVKSNKEAKLKDAEYTLSELDESEEGFCRFESPSYRSRRHKIDVPGLQPFDDDPDSDCWE